MKRGNIYLIHGFMGFGKTTVAKQLEKELDAVKLTHDEIMNLIFGRNLPEPEFRIAYDKIFELIWKLTEQITAAGTNVIIDTGFWMKTDRKSAYEKASKFANEVIFYNIICDMNTAKSRVLKRTDENKDELFIDENCFDVLTAKFEPISKDEGYKIIDIKND